MQMIMTILLIPSNVMYKLPKYGYPDISVTTPVSPIPNKQNSIHNIIVCIPAFNEDSAIFDVVAKCKQHSREVIVYDDGSTDDTRRMAEKAGATVIRNPINNGYGAAINALFRAAQERGADIMVTLDSDGQHDPDEIPVLVQAMLESKADVVIGSRFLNENSMRGIPMYRRVGIRAITRITRLASYYQLTDAQSGFRAYSKGALSKLDLYEDGMAASTEILIKCGELGLQVTEVPITVAYGIGDTSTSNPVIHGLSVASNVLQRISFKHPLLFYSIPGIALLFASAFVASAALDLFSSTRYISTNLILVSVGLAVVGVMLLSTGAIVYTLIALFKGKVKY